MGVFMSSFSCSLTSLDQCLVLGHCTQAAADSDLGRFRAMKQAFRGSVMGHSSLGVSNPCQSVQLQQHCLQLSEAWLAVASVQPSQLLQPAVQ